MSRTTLKPVDVVIVGAGVAGTIVAKELAATGLKVVALERGRMLDAQAVRLVEVDVDVTSYATGHIRGAAGWNWQTQLTDVVHRDIPSKAAWEALLSATGITALIFGSSGRSLPRMPASI